MGGLSGGCFIGSEKTSLGATSQVALLFVTFQWLVSDMRRKNLGPNLMFSAA